MNEIWKDVKGYEGRYQVSNLGNVKNVKTEYVLKKGHDAFGYDHVMFFNYELKKNENKLVHRLVAEAFIPNPHGYKVVDHINGDKKDNRVENLRWCSYRQNSSYFYNSDSGKNINLNNTLEKRKVSQYDATTGKRIAIYENNIKAEKETGVKNFSISACTRGRLKTAGGFIWKNGDAGEQIDPVIDRRKKNLVIIAKDFFTNEETIVYGMTEAIEFVKEKSNAASSMSIRYAIMKSLKQHTKAYGYIWFTEEDFRKYDKKVFTEKELNYWIARMKKDRTKYTSITATDGFGNTYKFDSFKKAAELLIEKNIAKGNIKSVAMNLRQKKNSRAYGFEWSITEIE